MNIHFLEVLSQKVRQRILEYIGLISFQSTIGFIVHNYLRIDTSLIIIAAASIIGWILTNLRERRRTLDIVDRSRILTDSLESLLLMILLVICTLIALKSGIELLVLQAHVCFFFAAFLLSSLFSEVVWRKKYLSTLDLLSQQNYLYNLNRSLIFPYNSTFLRSLFRK